MSLTLTTTVTLVPGDFCMALRGEWISVYDVTNRAYRVGTLKTRDTVLVIYVSYFDIGLCDVVVLHPTMGVVQCSSYLLEKV